MKLLLHPSYFPNIATFAALVQYGVVWEVWDNYQKQTYRNRCYVCTDQGKQLMNIPIKHVGGANGRQKYRNVRIDNSYRWQRQHLKTLQTAYRSSPFFEFYEDELIPLFEKRFEFLLDANLYIIEVICSLLDIDFPKEKTEKYNTLLEDKGIFDIRFLINAKLEPNFIPQSYSQVFEDRHGFIKNVSVLDLLFNEGTNALTYLKNQSTEYLNA